MDYEKDTENKAKIQKQIENIESYKRIIREKKENYELEKNYEIARIADDFSLSFFNKEETETYQTVIESFNARKRHYYEQFDYIESIIEKEERKLEETIEEMDKEPEQNQDIED